MNDSRFTPMIPRLLALMAVVFFGMTPRLLLAPLLLRISTDLGMTYDRASVFFLTNSVGFVAGLLTSGFVAERLNHKRTIVAGLFLTAVALILLSWVHSVWLFHILLFAGGWAIGLYPGSGIVSVTSIVSDVHRAKALAIHESGPNLAFILAPIIAAALAPVLGWRGVAQVVGLACLCVSLVFAAFGQASHERGGPPSFGNVAELAKNRSFWIISILFMVASTAAMGVYGVLPTYLVVEHGLPERFVNNLVGASRITGFLAILSAGGFADRFGFRPVVALILIITGIVTLFLGLFEGTALVVAVFLQPMIVGAFFPVALNAVSEVTVPERRNLAVALAIPMGTLAGSGIAPPLLTAAGAHGVFSRAFVLLGILTVASAGLLFFMRPNPRDDVRSRRGHARVPVPRR